MWLSGQVRLQHIAFNSGDGLRSFRATLRTVLESCSLYLANSTPSSSDFKDNVACLDLFHASNQHHCNASTGIETVLGKWSMVNSKQSKGTCKDSSCTVDGVR